MVVAVEENGEAKVIFKEGTPPPAKVMKLMEVQSTIPDPVKEAKLTA